VIVPTVRERAAIAVLGLAYIAVSLPLTLVCVVLLFMAAGIGVVLTPIGIGFTILGWTTWAAWRYARLERALANRLLSARIPPMPLPRRIEAAGWKRVRASVASSPSRRAMALAGIKLPATIAAAVAGFGSLALTLFLAVLGIEGLTSASSASYVGPARLGLVTGLILLVLAVPAAIVTVAILSGLADALRGLARSLLATEVAPGSPVREMLAESLGDRDLAIVYWLPDRGIFVNERGSPVRMPDAGSGRAWTSVDRGGRRVAAIVHDADLDAGPELVQAAAAASALALDNEQLKADLRARLEELRASRVRIVEAADAARRRLERDLHDGAQQQLVALAIDLRLLKARIHGDGEAAALVERANSKLAAALEDLRELARGIHPAILTDRGLVPALESLTRRIGIDGRLPGAVEAAAYFVVSEALTNVVKYARARTVGVEAWQEGDEVMVEVADDGVGGADAQSGSGLRGLADRLSAVDGRLEVDSPPGRGTRVRATIPCRAGSLVER
jgi:signal transduction histidine kinase